MFLAVVFEVVDIVAVEAVLFDVWSIDVVEVEDVSLVIQVIYVGEVVVAVPIGQSFFYQGYQQMMLEWSWL